MMLRRLKEDVEKNLAPKEETIIEVGLRSQYRFLRDQGWSQNIFTYSGYVLHSALQSESC